MLLQRFITQLRGSQGLQQSAVTILGNTLATGLSAVAIILISRLLGPEQFGEFSVGFAVILIVNKLNDAGLSAAVLKFAGSAKEKERQERIFNYTSKLKFFLSVFLVTLGVAITPWLANFLHFKEPTILYASFVFSVCSTWYEQLLAILQAQHRFREAILVNIMQSSVKLFGLGIAFFLGWKWLVLIFSWYMLAPIVPVLLSQFFLLKWFHLNLWLKNIPEKAQLLSMAKHSAIGLISAGFIENIDILFVQRYLSTYETGLLGGVSRIAMVILMIGYSLGNVLYPRVARYQKVEDIRAYFKKALGVGILASVGFLTFLPFGALSIHYTVGPEYLPGLPILFILVAASFLSVAAIPFQALFYSFKADWYFSVSGIIQLLIIVVGNGLFVPSYGLEASAWTRLVSRIFLFSFTFGASCWLYYRTYVATKHS